jgi:hypothetical protein
MSPKISSFYGIVIKMYFDDHNPPHFHAEYGEFESLIDIKTLWIMQGKLPPKALLLVIEWAQLHQDELLEQREKWVVQWYFGSIKPLE